MRSKSVLLRRNALTAAGAGLASLVLPRDAHAADTSAERANVQVVNNFCAADGVQRTNRSFPEPEHQVLARRRRLFPARPKNRGVVRLYDRDCAPNSPGALCYLTCCLNCWFSIHSINTFRISRLLCQ